MAKVAGYMGKPGAYGEQAANGYSEGAEVTTKGFATFSALFAAVEKGELDFAVCPAENSDSGTFRSVYDELVSHKVYIVGEHATQEDHCLCALPGTEVGDVSEVISHPSVLKQCDGFLVQLAKDNKRDLTWLQAHDTVAACENVAKHLRKERAALASSAAAQLNGLEVLQSSVGDDTRVSTRWIVISNKPKNVAHGSGREAKCSLALTLANEPGTLFKLLSCFAMRNLNILKFETRPAATASNMFIKANHWEYIFYVDFEPSPELKTNVGLMTNLEEYCHSVRDLGTYFKNVPYTAPEPAPWADASFF